MKMINFGTFYRDFNKKYHLNDKQFNNLNVNFIKTNKGLIWAHKLFIYYYSVLDEYYSARDFLAISQYNLRCNIFNIKDLDKDRIDLGIEHRGFRIYDEFLKVSFLKSMNIFDKIAVLLNHFEGLNIPDHKVNYYGYNKNNIFEYKKNGKKNLMEENPNNSYLLKLKKLQEKFDAKTEKNEPLVKYDLCKMRQFRNKLTHDYFIIHKSCNLEKIKHPYVKSQNLINKSNRYSHITYDAMLKYSIKGLKNARDAIFLTVNFINKKEQNIDKKYYNRNKVFTAKCGDNID